MSMTIIAHPPSTMVAKIASIAVSGRATIICELTNKIIMNNSVTHC